MRKQKTKTQEEEQIPLGVQYKGSPFIHRIKLRFSRYQKILEQFSFWRSPLLWLVFFVNGISIYWLFYTIASAESLPPEICVLRYTSRTGEMMLTPTFIQVSALVFSLFQIGLIYSSARMYFKNKTMSLFSLVVAALGAILFYSAVVKSVVVTIAGT